MRTYGMKALPAIIGTAALHLDLLTALVQAQEADPTSTTKEDPWLASGCSMAQGTALMLCLGDYASIPPAAPSGLTEPDQAAYYCDIYTQLANCWAAGLYCKEWYPMKIAADKFCILANQTSSTTSAEEILLPSQTTTLPPGNEVTGMGGAAAGADDDDDDVQDVQPTPAPAIDTDSTTAINTLSSIIAEASNVITSIWNNDSGTDIPVISNDLTTVTATGTGLETATASPVTWTHMSESTPLPATDPLGGTDTAMAAIVTPVPRLRRKVAFQ